METKEKIAAIRKFLSDPRNKLIWSKTDTYNAGTFFDIELLPEPRDIDFSICIKIINREEAITILQDISINYSDIEIEEQVNLKLNASSLNPEKEFYLVVKGNKDDSIDENKK